MAVLIILFVVVFIIAITLAWQSEKKIWNNGHCKDCNDEWRHFGNDSQGGRGYVCKCGNCIWISYPVD